jgi:hypothetical protein
MSSDFKKEEFYKKIHPELFGEKTWTQSIKKGLVGALYFWKGSDKYTEIKHGEVIVNLPLFMKNVDIIQGLLKKVQHEEDINVLTVTELKNVLIANSVSLSLT